MCLTETVGKKRGAGASRPRPLGPEREAAARAMGFLRDVIAEVDVLEA